MKKKSGISPGPKIDSLMCIGILCHDSVGGSTRVAIELAYGLAKQGHDLHIFSYSPPYGEWKTHDRITWHTIRKSRSINCHPTVLRSEWAKEEIEDLISCITEATRNYGIDLLNFHYAMPFADICHQVQARLGSARPSIVGTLHGTDVRFHNSLPEWRKKSFQLALRKIDMLTSVSLSHARLSQEVFSLPELPIVIPNFINPNRFRPGKKTANQGSNNSVSPKYPTIIHVSNLRAVKRVQDVAKIFSGMRKRAKVQLWLVGDNGEINGTSVKNVFDKLNLDDSVHFWGLQHDVSKIVRQADLMLVTSEYESFCLSGLEAMASGVPVLAPRVGGLPETVLNYKTGLLYPPGEIEVAIEMGLEILTRQDYQQSMPKSARRHALKYKDTDIIPRYEDLFRKLVF